MKLLTALLLALLLAAGLAATDTETCYFTSEKVSGLNKICYYSCPSGTAAITIKSSQLCPLNIKR